jgi:sulfur-oxidizing protein SoxX
MIRNVALAVVLLAAPAAVRAQTPGENIAFDRAKGNCLACHTMRGGDVPSSVGPELKGMNERFPVRADLVAIVTNEQTRNPQTVMPPFGLNLILNDDEINRIVDFLYTL